MTTQTTHQTTGPASLVGVTIGLLLAGTLAMTDLWRTQAGWLLFCIAPPLVGVGLMLVPGGVRRFGLGLLASALAIPVFVLSWPFAAILAG